MKCAGRAMMTLQANQRGASMLKQIVAAVALIGSLAACGTAAPSVAVPSVAVPSVAVPSVSAPAVTPSAVARVAPAKTVYAAVKVAGPVVKVPSAAVKVAPKAAPVAIEPTADPQPTNAPVGPVAHQVPLRPDPIIYGNGDDGTVTAAPLTPATPGAPSLLG